MQRRFGKQKRASRERRLALERLETRVVLDGGIRALMSGGGLRIQGDAQDNDIIIEQLGPRKFSVSSRDGATLINGQAGARTFNNVRGDINVALGAGGDVLEIKGSGAALTRLVVDTGAGADDVLINGLAAARLSINTGADSDRLLIGRGSASGVRITSDAVISTGSGQDRARIANSVFKRDLKLDLGASDDVAVLQNVSVAKKSSVSGGTGSDASSREGNRGDLKFASFEATSNSIAEGEAGGISVLALAVGDTATVVEDETPNRAVGNVLANDTGGPDINRVVAVSGFAANVGTSVPGQHGTFQINADGTFTYILNNADVAVNSLNDGQTLTDAVEYTIDDGIDTSTGSLTITIEGDTDTGPLVAVNDAATVVEDAIPNTARGNLLSNDTGGTGAKVITAVNSFAANVGTSVPGQFGFFQINADGTFSYILNNANVAVNALNNGQTLTDTAAYTVNDGSGPVTATLTITIQGNTDTSPLAAVNDAATVVENAIPSTAVGNVLANDTGGTAAKTVTSVSGFAANVGRSLTGQFGFFQINLDGTFSYLLNNDNPTVNALNAGQTLTDSVSYIVTSGSETSTGTLAITIQGLTDTGPLAAVNDTAVVIEDAIPNGAVGNVLANDTGGAASKIVTAVSGFAANVGRSFTGQFGVFQINADGTFTYLLRNDNPTVNALNAGQTLTDSIPYTVTNGNETATGTLTITIQGVTDTTPLAAVNDAATIVENTIPNTAVGNVLTNDTGGTAAKLVTSVSGFAANIGRSVTGQFGFFQINADGTFSYILNNDNPTVNGLNAGQTLIDSITYVVTSGAETSTGTLAITIQGITDTGPLATVNDTAVVVENAIPNTAVGNVLANDTGGVAAKIVTAVSGFAANVGRGITGQFGFFQINADGTFTYILNNDNPTVNGLNAGQTLTDSVTYVVTSGNETSTGTLAITIQGITDTSPLAAVNDTAIVIENAIPNTAVGNVLANDTGGTGADVVTAVNGFAANVGRGITGQFGFFQINADGTFTYILNNDNSTVNALNAGQTLTDSVPYTVTNGAETSTGTLSITIQGVTDTGPLTAVNDTALVIEDAIPNTAVGNVLANDTGGVAAKIVTAVSGFAANVGRGVTGQFGFFQINADGTFSYILRNDSPTVNALNAGQTLTDSIPYTVTSGSETATGTLTITIQGNTDTGPLAAVNDAALVIEDAIPNTAVGNVLINDIGGIAPKVVIAVKGLAANIGTSVQGKYGVFQINADGTFSYLLRNGKAAVNALNDGQTLTDSLAYTMTDGTTTSSANLVITIQGNTD